MKKLTANSLQDPSVLDLDIGSTYATVIVRVASLPSTEACFVRAVLSRPLCVRNQNMSIAQLPRTLPKRLPPRAG
jgi:hypothetical protein